MNLLLAVIVLSLFSCSHNNCPAGADASADSTVVRNYGNYKSPSIPPPYSRYYMEHPRKLTRRSK